MKIISILNMLFILGESGLILCFKFLYFLLEGLSIELKLLLYSDMISYLSL